MRIMSYVEKRCIEIAKGKNQKMTDKPELAFFSKEQIDAIGDTRSDEELAAYKESLVELGREIVNRPIRQTRIKELVCLLQGSVEGCIEFCYHPSLDRILERVMELKKEIEKIND